MDAPASIREETTLRCPENMSQLFISTESCIYGVVCPIHNDSLKIPKIHIFLFQLWFLGNRDFMLQKQFRKILELKTVQACMMATSSTY